MNQVVLGASPSILAEARETEQHLHNHEYTFGLHPAYVSGVTCGTRDTLTPYTLASGINRLWGNWYCLLGSQDTPVKAGFTKFDPHRLVMTDASIKNQIFKIQFVAATAADVAAHLAAHEVSEFPFSPFDTKTQDRIREMMEDREDTGIPFWARLQADTAAAQSINFFLLVHEYLV